MDYLDHALGTSLLLDEIAATLSSDELLSICETITNNWDLEPFETKQEDTVLSVLYPGEYDINEQGEVKPLVKRFNSFNEAKKDMDAFEQETGIEPSILSWTM